MRNLHDINKKEEYKDWPGYDKYIAAHLKIEDLTKAFEKLQLAFNNGTITAHNVKTWTYTADPIEDAGTFTINDDGIF